MTTKNVLHELAEIVSDVTGNEKVELSLDMTANDVEGWDSLSHVQILYSCEIKWGIRLSLQELSSLKTIGDLVEIITNSLN